ncbi:MAG: RodZ domain-containing protein [Steroidobacteraceae bacterium]
MAVAAGGIGARLRAGREKLGLTVLQVAERIHTDPKIVDAIEAENYEALGAPVYARGHIRHYAELVGESATELIALYSDLSKVAQPDLTRIVKAPAGSDSSKLVAPALLVMAVFAVAGAVWWVSALSKKKPQLAETHVVGDEEPAAGSESPPDAAGVQGQSGAAVPGATAVPGGTAVPGRTGGLGGTGGPGGTAVQSRAGTAVPQQGSAPAPVAPGRTGGTPNTGRGGAAAGASSAPGAQARAGGTAVGAPAPAGSQARARGTVAPGAPQSRAGAGSAAPASAGAAGQARSSAGAGAGTTPTRTASAVAPPATVGSASTAAAGTTVPPRSKNQAQVTLRYSADSWTEVYDSSGARLFYDVGAANSIQTVVGTPPLRVVLGNASGVAVEFNGHSKPVAKLAQPDGSVQFSINRAGRVVRAKPGADGG